MTDERVPIHERLQAWVESVGLPWSVESATRGNSRVLYDDRKVVIAYDTSTGVTGFVDCVTASDLDALSEFGAPSGFDAAHKGVNVVFSDVDGFLGWCQRVVPSRANSLDKLDRSRTGPRQGF